MRAHILTADEIRNSDGRPQTITKHLNQNKMKYYHLTFLRDCKYVTAFACTTSIANFLLIEKELGREVHILYSRDITEEEYYQISKRVDD